MLRFRDSQTALQQGAKIIAEDLAGVIGLPQVGNTWYVDAVNGSDTTNDGTAWNQAFKTYYQAHSAATTNNYDQITVAPAGTGSGTGTDESVYGRWTFSKSLITTIGGPAPSRVSPRARILWGTASQSTTTNPLLTISGQGNRFLNIQWATFVDNNVLVKLTGQRNTFAQVHFAGIGDATAGDDADARCLWVSGGSENWIEDSIVGLDTIARSTSNAEIVFDTSATRNTFVNTDILTYADNAGHFFVTAGATSIDRWVKFYNCGFINPINSAATTMTDAMSLSGSAGGSVIGIDSYKIGATGWADTVTVLQLLSVSSNSTYNQGIGFPVNPNT